MCVVLLKVSVDKVQFGMVVYGTVLGGQSEFSALNGNVYYAPDEQPSGYKKVGTNSQSI